jgi:hypothetical protein
MNGRSLDVLIEHLEEPDQVCPPDLRAFHEDTCVARLLKKQGIVPHDTRDEKGEERFNPFVPSTHLLYAPPREGQKGDWYHSYSVDLKYGLQACSADSVSFHYMKPTIMRKVHGFLYECAFL